MPAVRNIRPLLPPAVRRLYRTVFPHRPPDRARLWRDACQKWMVGSAHVQDRYLVIHGWLIAPPDKRPFVGFRINGKPPHRIDYPLPRPDVAAEKEGFAPGARESGFVLWLKLASPSTGPGDVEVTAVDQRTGEDLGKDYLPFNLPGRERLGPLPSDQFIARVIGEPSVVSFGMGGFTTFHRLARAVRDATGQELTDFPRVLDWGCGCARVSRYFLQLPSTQLTGVDVDPETVGWAREHLSGGTWEAVPLRPPTTLPDAGFDLAVGVSVFTHLKEPDQFAWLGELGRVIRPGGLALMTFHGEASVLWSGLSGERYAALQRDGFCIQSNPLYDADLPEADYYCDTFHTLDYVRREWGRYFEVLAIRPCFVSHQDLVVLRRR